MRCALCRPAILCMALLWNCVSSGAGAAPTAVVDKDTGRPVSSTTLLLRLPSGAEQRLATDAQGLIVLPAAAVETGVTLTHRHYLKASATPWQDDDAPSLLLAHPDPTHGEYPQPGNLVFGLGVTRGALRSERDDGFVTLDTPGVGRSVRGLRPDELQFDRLSTRAVFAQASIGLSRIGGAREFLDLALVGRFGVGVAELHAAGDGPDLESSAEPYWSLGLNARARRPHSSLYLAAGFRAGRLEESVLSDKNNELEAEQIRLEHLFAAGHLGVGGLLGDLAGRPLGARGRCSAELGAAWQGIATDVGLTDALGTTTRTVEQDLVRKDALSGYVLLGIPIGRRDMGYARVVCDQGGGWTAALVFARWLPFLR